MKRVLFALVGTVASLVLLLSFKTHSTVTTPAAAIRPAQTDATTSAEGTSPAGTSAAPTTSATKSSGSQTVTGDSVDTRWGPVQVQITVANGKLAAVDAVVYPQNNPRDEEINAYAIPALNQEALAAGSAQIDMISGATVTSDGYLTSLQSALDKAGL